MVLAILILAASAADLVPARWPGAEVSSLELLRNSPVNCLLLEQPHWSPEFLKAAARDGVKTYAVITPNGDAAAAAGRAAAAGFSGAVLEGAFEPGLRDAVRKALAAAKLDAVELSPRDRIRFSSSDPVLGTSQGLWPGIREEEPDQHKAGPSGAPWIDTNTGFLRFARALTKATLWMGVRPPPGKTYPIERYLQAAGDAAMTGARWVVAFDDEMNRKLLAGDKRALDGWRRLGALLRYFEQNRHWRDAQPFAQLALVEDSASGALLSGGILDMIAVKHTPVRPVPPSGLTAESMAGAKMAVNVDPQSLSAEQRQVLTAFTRSGGTLLTGPPGWKFPEPRPGQITLAADDVKKLDEIWRELNAMTGRRNLGARLFNVSTMLSSLLETPDRSQVVLHLVNYSDYPAENVTIHVLGRYKSARLLRPEGAQISLEGYDIEEGTGYDIEQVGSFATLVLTR